jgi:hypothetical protein
MLMSFVLGFVSAVGLMLWFVYKCLLVDKSSEAERLFRLEFFRRKRKEEEEDVPHGSSFSGEFLNRFLSILFMEVTSNAEFLELRKENKRDVFVFLFV